MGAKTTPTATTTLSPTKTPKNIYELKMYGLEGEPKEIIINTSIGDTVDCEVNVIGDTIFCSIKDSHGNAIVESSRTTYTTSVEMNYYPGVEFIPAGIVTNTVNLQKYPWTYSFNAADQLYTFAVNSLPSISSGEPSMYVKITIR